MFPNLTEHAFGVHVLSAVGRREAVLAQLNDGGWSRASPALPGRETDACFGRKLLRERSARRLLSLLRLDEEQ